MYINYLDLTSHFAAFFTVTRASLRSLGVRSLTVKTVFESHHEKTYNVVSEQVRHKLGSINTEDD